MRFHITEPELLQYCQGELNAETMQDIKDHLKSCSKCEVRWRLVSEALEDVKKKDIKLLDRRFFSRMWKRILAQNEAQTADRERSSSLLETHGYQASADPRAAAPSRLIARLSKIVPSVSSDECAPVSPLGMGVPVSASGIGDDMVQTTVDIQDANGCVICRTQDARYRWTVGKDDKGFLVTVVLTNEEDVNAFEDKLIRADLWLDGKPTASGESQLTRVQHTYATELRATIPVQTGKLLDDAKRCEFLFTVINA